MIGRGSRRIGVLFLLVMVAAGRPGAQPADPPTARPAAPEARRVLLLNSFERGSATENLFAGMLRSELNRQFHAPINFFEVSLQPALQPDQPKEGRIVDYLLATFGQRLDLVITLGGPAAEFAQRHRARIFPTTPLLIAAMEQQWVEGRPLAANETALGVVTEPEKILADIQRVLPDTRHVFAIIGGSPVERLWLPVLSRRFQEASPGLTFTWSSDLSYEDTLKRAAALPPHSVIFYLLLAVDANGVAQEEERTLAELHATANAPLFGLYDIQVGRGAVGGSVLSVVDAVRNTATVARRILQGESPGSITTAPQRHGAPVFDWRELRRWNIPEARLPAGSVVQFRQPSVWDEYKAYILGAVALVALQSALIAGLIVQRARQRRTESALQRSYGKNRDLVGRLIHAQEVERTRIARDLHDDVSQQLASVGLVLSGLKRKIGTPADGEIEQGIVGLQERTATLARSIRTLSHELHPGMISHGGLASTLQRHCADVERLHHLTVSFDDEGDLDEVGPDVALCLFRVAQEALTNAVRHGRARTVSVRLAASPEGVALAVRDDGIGFVPGEDAGRGLGLRSIAERVRLVGGTARVESRPGEGTSVLAAVPAAAAAGGPAS